MKVSVYGGTGFVGSEFVRQNLGQCHVVGREERRPPTPEILYFISTVDNYNVYSDPLLDVNTNLIVLLEVLEQARLKYGNEFTFNFVSSWFVYGDTEQPAREDSPCNPKGFYSITKRTAEQLLISFCETFGCSYRIFRLPNVLGAGDKKVSAKRNALQFLIKQMQLGFPIKLYYGGDFYRDYMDVRDVADAIRFLMRYSSVNEIYNVCDEDASTYFKEVFDACYSVLKSKSVVTIIDEVDFHRAVQVKSMAMDYSKLAGLGWKRKYDMLDILDGILGEG